VIDEARTKEVAQLELLRGWLAKPHWNFSRDYNSFDGVSEGICLMTGIDPELSMLAGSEYGPKFLPDAMKTYGFDSTARGDEISEMRSAIQLQQDRFRVVGLSGLSDVKKALLKYDRRGLRPPWFDCAQNDFHCARGLPIELIEVDEMRERLTKYHRSNAGKARASKNEITQLIAGPGRQEFDRLRKDGFSGQRANSSGRVVGTSVAHEVYDAIRKFKGEAGVLPQLGTVRTNVRSWLQDDKK